MKISISTTRVLQFVTTVFMTLVILPPSWCKAQTVPSDPPYSVVDRGPFYRVLQRTVSVTNHATGDVSQQVQSYTELEDGMHYLSNNIWVEAQDLIEVTATGAKAVHGQMTATFNSDITSVGAISLTTAAGEVFQSHPIGLFYTDRSSGKVAQIASVQSSVGTLYPPNVIVFSNVLSGLRADLMLVWTKKGYEQNLVLKQNPPPPGSFSMSSSSTTLQLWSSMDSCPAPNEQRPVLLDSGLEDHILIFDGAWFPVGGAFAFGNTPLPSAGQPAAIRQIRPSESGVVPVAKSLVNIADQQVLIEEVRYIDLAPVLSQLPQASFKPKSNQTVELADRAVLLRPAPRSTSERQPMETASTQYNPAGVILDYTELSGTTNTYTFLSNTTYRIRSSFTVSQSGAYFQQNTCVKFDTNAFLELAGNLTFPTSGSPAVFTSKDDNAYGFIFSDSTANPDYAALEAVWMYYQGNPSGVTNVLVRWSQTAIRVSAQTYDPWISASALQNCNLGVSMNVVSTKTLHLSQVTACNVATNIHAYGGQVSGTITTNCGVATVAMVNDPNRDLYDYDTNKNSQTEGSFVVCDSTNIVAAFMNTHLSEFQLGAYGAGYFVPVITGIPSPRMATWAASRNGGTNFTDNGPVPPLSTITKGATIITNGAPNPTQGDAGDTVMTYDPSQGTYGTIYLLTNPSRESGYQGFRLWTSTNKGTNFTLINTNVPGGVSSADKPMIKVNPTNHVLYVAGSTDSQNTWAARSFDGGTTWTNYQSLESSGAESRGADIVIVQDNTVYVFWLRSPGLNSNFTNQLRYAFFSTNATWSASANFGTHLNSTNFDGNTQLLRFAGDNTNDWVSADSYPRVGYANGHIYVAYCDVSVPGSTTDRGDIFLVEGNVNWTDHTLSVGYGPRKINNDNTQTDQWNPSIAVNPAGTELFIGYYSRQNDPVTNSWIMAYGAKGYITNGLVNATFDSIPISTSQFQPLFAGTKASSNNVATFEPLWAPAGVCLDTNSVYNGPWGGGTTSCSGENIFSPLIHGTDYTYVNFCADDYTWSVADSNYFYFAWCDRSRTNGVPPNARPDADIKFAKIKP